MPLFGRHGLGPARRLRDALTGMRGRETAGAAHDWLDEPAPREASSEPAPAIGPASGRRAVLIACTILGLGLLVSALGAIQWRDKVRASERQSFQTTATEVSETLGTQIRRQTDFVSTLDAVMTMQPGLSQEAFGRWYTALEGRQRQIGGLGTTVVASVPAAQLQAFLARRNASAEFRETVGRLLPVARTGSSHYCLISTLATVSGRLSDEISGLVQADWCSPKSVIGTVEAPLQRLAADSGQLLAVPAVAQGLHTLIFYSAFYHRGAPTATTAQRRAAVQGWVLSTFDVASVMRVAVGAQKGLSVSLYHRNPDSTVALVGTGGNGTIHGPYSRTTALQIEGPWRVTVQGAIAASGPGATAQGLLVFLGGALLSAMLSALALVVLRSRARALGMVEEKTGQLRHQALHDALTGLPNRVLALDRAEQMLARARRQQLPVAALFVDVDGFKHVNDTFGHATGDELLRMVAARLSGVVREGDTAARLGGDEFVVLVEGSTLDAGPELVAERLLEVLRQPYELGDKGGRRLSLTVSIGVAAGLRADADELLRDADIALYEAKAAGRNRYVMFRSDMQTLVQDKLRLEMDLAEALERDELFILYQPTFDLRTEQVIGVEALLRWRHPTRGVLAPDEFIPIAEESRLIVPIGRWVLEQACMQAASWRERGLQLDVAVNVSGRQLDADELIDHVRGALQASGLEPAALTLEVTETTLMADAEASAGRLRALKSLGVRIAIDDFGTGYSSLAYLRQFPADALKIDRSFVASMTGSRQSTALVHTLVQLGRTLHLETLAEGIEDEAQLKTLRREQCDQGQGFLFARPLDVEELEEFLAGSEHAPATLPRR